MTVRIIRSGTRKKPTEKSVQYSTTAGSFYAKKEDLKAAGCTEAPENLFFIITDELPEGWEIAAAEQESHTFEL